MIVDKLVRRLRAQVYYLRFSPSSGMSDVYREAEMPDEVYAKILARQKRSIHSDQGDIVIAAGLSSCWRARCTPWPVAWIDDPEKLTPDMHVASIASGIPLATGRDGPLDAIIVYNGPDGLREQIVAEVRAAREAAEAKGKRMADAIAAEEAENKRLLGLIPTAKAVRELRSPFGWTDLLQVIPADSDRWVTVARSSHEQQWYAAHAACRAAGMDYDVVRGEA